MTFMLENDTRRAHIPGGQRFDFMFPGVYPPQGDGVPGATLRGWLTQLGVAMIDDVAGGLPLPSGDNMDLPAGYTYFGQFVDHDITFDPTRLPDDPIDIRELTNFRSSAPDLECLLGFGPSVHPFLYTVDASNKPNRLRLGRRNTTNAEIGHDVLRLPAPDNTGLMGDPRNDENLLIGQLHSAFVNVFNAIATGIESGAINDRDTSGGSIAERAGRVLRWHYQWIILHDYLPRILQQDILDTALNNPLRFYTPAPRDAYMPVEFAAAAYRFGHTLVRQSYHVNSTFTSAPLRDIFAFSSTPVPRPPPKEWSVNLRRLFELEPRIEPNWARRIDPYLAPGLHEIPAGPVPLNLAVQNLLRGWTWKLPNGQRVAQAMGLAALTPDEILAPRGQRCKEANIVENFRFHLDTPLWYYILKEADVRHAGKRLGPVGSTIVAETFVGLMRADKESVLNQPGWTPFLQAANPPAYQLADLLSLLPPEALDENGADVGPLQPPVPASPQDA